MANLIEGIQKIVELLLAIENTYIMSDATKEEAKQEYLRILSQTKQKIVQDKVKEAFEGQTLTFKEIESKPTNKNIKILYSDSFCRCIYNEETEETDFSTYITGESLHYNLSENYHEQVLFFKNKNDEKSFDVHSSTCFPDKGSDSTEQWKIFCYSCMSYILQNEIKDKILYDVPDSVKLYIKAVDTIFEEKISISYNDPIRTGIYPPKGGLILYRQNKIIKKWDDYTTTHIHITEAIESILYEIRKVITK